MINGSKKVALQNHIINLKLLINPVSTQIILCLSVQVASNIIKSIHKTSCGLVAICRFISQIFRFIDMVIEITSGPFGPSVMTIRFPQNYL